MTEVFPSAENSSISYPGPCVDRKVFGRSLTHLFPYSLSLVCGPSLRDVSGDYSWNVKSPVSLDLITEGSPDQS